MARSVEAPRPRNADAARFIAGVGAAAIVAAGAVLAHEHQAATNASPLPQASTEATVYTPLLAEPEHTQQVEQATPAQIILREIGNGGYPAASTAEIHRWQSANYDDAATRDRLSGMHLQQAYGEAITETNRKVNVAFGLAHGAIDNNASSVTNTLLQPNIQVLPAFSIPPGITTVVRPEISTENTLQWRVGVSAQQVITSEQPDALASDLVYTSALIAEGSKAVDPSAPAQEQLRSATETVSKPESVLAALGTASEWYITEVALGGVLVNTESTQAAIAAAYIQTGKNSQSGEFAQAVSQIQARPSGPTRST